MLQKSPISLKTHVSNVTPATNMYHSRGDEMAALQFTNNYGTELPFLLMTIEENLKLIKSTQLSRGLKEA